jgi:hypothetical protein
MGVGGVRQHRRDRVTLLEACGPKPVHEPVALGEELDAAPLAAVGVDEGELRRIPLGEVPEA